LSNLAKGLILLLVVLGVGAGLVVWKNKVGGSHAGNTQFNSISREEVEMLLADVAKVNPMVLKRFAEDPEMKKQQLENLKQLLAFASEAKKQGLADEPTNKQELENIRAEVEAVNYDKEINKDKGPMPPFGFITEDQTKAFWGEGGTENKGFFASLKDKIGLGSPDRELEFEKFLDTKIKLLKESNPQMKDREISEDEKAQAKEFFAKINIYKDEYERKAAAGELPKEFQDKIALQTKLQQAQFLARLVSDKMAEKTKVTDEEVAKYISEHPELDMSSKRAKAEEVLARAKNGEDFAALANEFSEDPGNKGPKGEMQGGLYKDITKGKMVAPFETAALALEPGQIAPDLVETDYGYHIIKLEKKGEGKDASGKPAETYDARHILFMTGVKDPTNPMSREMPVKQFARQELEKQKQKQLLDEIVASNNVSVPDDFTVPEVTEEQMQQMMQKQQEQMQQMQGMGEGEGSTPGQPGKPEPKKPDAKKGK
jgi:parvulin-like peptidyl-prolyl isomerase